jgi:hypothetical protein
MFFFLKNKLGLNPKHTGKTILIPLRCICTSGRRKLESCMHKFHHLFKMAPDFFLNLCSRLRSRVLRKISVINDKEGNTCEVAIGNYWLQTAISPLHHCFFWLLRRIEQDCTHDQRKLLSKLVRRTITIVSSLWS